MDSIAKKLSQLLQHQLVGIYLDSFLASLNLEFTNGYSKQDIILRFTQIIKFSIDKHPEDDEGCFLVGSMDIDIFNKSNKNIILLKNINLAYKKLEIFHFYMDGDIRIELAFGSLNIFENQ